MTTKEYLRQLMDSRNELKSAIYTINEQRSLLTSISINTDNERVQSSSDPDKMSTMIGAILEREAELQIKVEKYLALENMLSAMIDKLPNPLHRDVLRCRYINCMTFDAIRVCIDKSLRHVTRIHGMALLKIEKMFGEIYL